MNRTCEDSEVVARLRADLVDAVFEGRAKAEGEILGCLGHYRDHYKGAAAELDAAQAAAWRRRSA